MSLAIFDLDQTLLRGDSDHAWGEFLVEQGAVDRRTLERWRTDFMRTRILPLITPAARTLVDQHRARGDTLMIITATNRFITAPIAAEFGITELIATDPEERDGQFTGKVSGVPSYREGKVTRLTDWLHDRHQSLDDSWFYSDSHNDLPLLNLVANPVAVNPDDVLRDYASRRGWPVLTLE